MCFYILPIIAIQLKSSLDNIDTIINMIILHYSYG